MSAGAFDDPRVKLLFEDAKEALLKYKNTFDVIVIDCNDAVGPSEALFEEIFYKTVSHALKEQGICSVQVGSMLDMDFLKQARQRIETHLGTSANYKLTIPSYHCGEYVFIVASNTLDPTGSSSNELTALQSKRNIITKYWSPEMHHASQVFPPQIGA